MEKTTPRHHKPDFRQYVQELNDQFGLDIPVLGIQSPSARENNTTLPYRVYKHLRPLFYNTKVNKQALKGDLEEWVHGRAGLSEAHAPLSPSSDQKEERLNYLLQLMKDEEYLLENGRQENGKRLAVDDPPGELRGLCRKKRRIADEEDDFYTAPNSPSKDSVLAQSPLSKHGDGALQFPQMAHVKSQAHTGSEASNALGRQDGLTQPPKKYQQASRAPAKYSATFPPPLKNELVQTSRDRRSTKALSKPQTGPYSPITRPNGAHPTRSPEVIKTPGKVLGLFNRQGVVRKHPNRLARR